MIDPVKIVEQYKELLPSYMRPAPWERTGHGCDILETDDHLNAYIVAYGEMHMIKCRAALQNFPFEKLNFNTFEIFDWGCGQGIATLTLIDMLKQRDLLGQLHRITLIEPGKPALERAKSWIKPYVGENVTIKCINRRIPSDNNEVWDDIECSTYNCISIFSNILDLPSLNLKWLARNTTSLAPQNFVICVGPKFSKESRITDFCGYFNPTSYFSDICIHPYGYTTHTNYPFGCEAKCFVHHNLETINDTYIEIASNYDFVNEYDYAAESLKGVLTDSLLELYNLLRKWGGTYRIFPRPSINTTTADLILVSKTKGIIIINESSGLKNLEEDYRRLEAVKDSLFDMHLKTIKIDSVINRTIYNHVKIALYFPINSIGEINKAIKEKEDNMNKERAEESQNKFKYKNKEFYKYLLKLTKSNYKDELNVFAKGFKDEYYSELIDIIIGKWHSYKEGDLNLRLTRRQEEIVRSANSRIRVKGVAGSGKTQIVAYRAVERHLKTGDKVLIITFNITLIQYIRMRINQVPADFSTAKFEILNYHQFFNSMLNRYAEGRKLSLSDYDNKEFFKPYASKIEKYKTIIIDEVQDFKESWLYSIIHYFLAPDGFITVFGDGEQNIYNRGIEQHNKMPTVPTFSGLWIEASERLSMRMLNPQIATLCYDFLRTFVNSDYDPIAAQHGILFENNYHIKYWNIGFEQDALLLAKRINGIIEEYSLESRNVVVLGLYVSRLRDVVKSYTQETKKGVMINFETAEQYKEVKCKTHPSFIKKTLADIRRVAKVHFTTDCDEVKFSTIHSFKGWEAETVILLLEPENDVDAISNWHGISERENTSALIYTALTRAKCNLFIINLGNYKYDSFFKQEVDSLKLH